MIANDTFCHEALFYSGFAEFIETVGRFVREGVDLGEPVLVIADDRKIKGLQSELGSRSAKVRFADMAVIGRNPGLILAAWEDHFHEHAGGGQRIRGVGEPINQASTGQTLDECHRQEALLNVAFVGSSAWWLLCPYDTAALSDAVVREARRNHPFLGQDGHHVANPSARTPHECSQLWSELEPAQSSSTSMLVVDDSELSMIRRLATEEAAGKGICAQRSRDVGIVVEELVKSSNPSRGSVWIQMWQGPEAFICEILDSNGAVEPLAGHLLSFNASARGEALSLAHALSDLVQQRSDPDTNAVRIHFLTES